MGKKSILIADDEANIRLLVSRSLSKFYNVLEARDGEEALKVARSNKPALILMDIMMPKMDGYTACYTIKADPELRSIPVLMVTGLGYHLNKELASKLGAEGYIVKPFTTESLRTAIEQHLGTE